MSFLQDLLPRYAPISCHRYCALWQTIMMSSCIFADFNKLFQDGSMDDGTLDAAKGFIMKLKDLEFVFMLVHIQALIFDIVQQRTMDVFYCKKENRVSPCFCQVEEVRGASPSLCKSSKSHHQTINRSQLQDPQDHYRNLFLAILDNHNHILSIFFKKHEHLRTSQSREI